MVSQITGVPIVCSTVCSGADQRTSKFGVTGLCEGNPPVTGGFLLQMKKFQFDDVIMIMDIFDFVAIFIDPFSFLIHQVNGVSVILKNGE